MGGDLLICRDCEKPVSGSECVTLEFDRGTPVTLHPACLVAFYEHNREGMDPGAVKVIVSLLGIIGHART
jgi:hypothetical protein